MSGPPSPTSGTGAVSRSNSGDVLVSTEPPAATALSLTGTPSSAAATVVADLVGPRPPAGVASGARAANKPEQPWPAVVGHHDRRCRHCWRYRRRCLQGHVLPRHGERTRHG